MAMKRSPSRRKRMMIRRRRRFGMSSLDANPFRQGTGRSLKMLTTLQGQRSSDSDRIMMVWIYADWCGFCHRMLPVWKSLVKRNPEIDFVIMDGDSTSFGSNVPEEYPPISGFPTLWIFSPGSQEPIVYRGERSIHGIENTIHKL
jgi:thiol-disulfide isomerase/thioredoxin